MRVTFSFFIFVDTHYSNNLTSNNVYITCLCSNLDAVCSNLTRDEKSFPIRHKYFLFEMLCTYTMFSLVLIQQTAEEKKNS